MKILDSKRLKYQIMTSEDSEQLYQLDQDPEVMRFITNGKMTTREEIAQIYIPRMKSYTNLNEGWGLWKVIIKSSEEFIGWVLVRPMNFFTDNPELNNLELGWRFKKSSWGNGYATEAAVSIKEALLKNSLLDTTNDVTQLTAIAIEGNLASTNIMKKLGMKYVKTDLHKDPLGDAEVVFYQLKV